MKREIRDRPYPPERSAAHGVHPGRRPGEGARVLHRARGLAVLLAAALALTACQSIPASGPVREGLANFAQADQPVQFNPDGPSLGASKEEIVRGFVRAASSSSDDYAIAREFLVPTYSTEWDPSLGVFIDEGEQGFREVDGDVGVLSLRALATLDDSGTLTPVQPGPVTEARFELEQVQGEWRIASAPAGTILDKSTFTAVWSSRQVYFLSPDNRLVSESRWFLNRPTLTTQIVSALVEGPSADMTGALRTAFPAGTTLVANSVPVVDGTAQIDLSVELLAADTATLELITRQLGASLQAVPGLSRFQLSADGVVVMVAPVSAPTESSLGTERFGTVVLSDGVFGEISGRNLIELPAIGDRVAELDPIAVALSLDHSSAAVQTDSGVTWVSDDALVQIDVRPGLREPSFDGFEYIWSYAASAPGEILVTKPGESQQLLQMPWLTGRSAEAVRVSKQGTRLAILVSDGDYSAVLIAGIVRDAAGRPIELSETATVQLWVPGTPTDLDWVDDQRFATLSRTVAAGRITFGAPGQFATDSGVVSDAVSLAGGGSRVMLRVLSGDGRMFAPQGVGWQQQEDDISLIAKTG